MERTVNHNIHNNTEVDKHCEPLDGVALELFKALDDIDTYSDMAKENSELFENLTLKRIRKCYKENGIVSDGYKVWRQSKYGNHEVPPEEEKRCGGQCCDDRFEVIAEAKRLLLEATNINTSDDEMACLDSFLFRCWQMGWLSGVKQHEETAREIIAEMRKGPPGGDETPASLACSLFADRLDRAISRDCRKCLSDGANIAKER